MIDIQLLNIQSLSNNIVNSRSFGLEYALLALLKDNPMHGYQLHQRAADPQGLGLVWRVNLSLLYALLEKLENDALVESSQQHQDLHPPRRVYKLTEKGEAAGREWAVTPVQRPHQMRQIFMAKLYSAAYFGPGLQSELIQGQKQMCAGWLANIQARGQALENRGGQGDTASWYERAVGQYRRMQIEGILAWLEDCQRYLR